jgi:nicotinate-nucleotide--dimethylbenzimidazole phosphoribosyltransferase
VGAGALPVGEHRRRPPIPIVPVDARARASARARRAGDVAVWAAGVTGADPPRIHVRAVIAGGAGSVQRPDEHAPLDVVHIDSTIVPSRDITRDPAMSVGEVALAVDTGREIAAQAARDGRTVLVLAGSEGRSATAARALTGALTGAAPAGSGREVIQALALHAEQITGPLGALRRLGTPAIAVLSGAALGAGERGLGCVCHGLAATAAAALAAGIEPALRARLIAARPARDPAHAALLDHLGLAALLGEGDGADAITAAAEALRAAAAGTSF